MSEAIRAIGVTEVTYFRWRNEYGGLKGDQVKRLKELETENALLRAAGWSVNKKRVERIWRREELKVPARQPKRGRL